MDLVQTAFRDRVLVEEATWKAVVLILKGGDDYYVIYLVEVVWKAVTVIFNFCFASSAPTMIPFMVSGQVAVRGPPTLRSNLSIR